jgi:hypothetical protein
MNQRFVYHPLNRAGAPRRPHSATASVAVSEYLAYIATLSIAVVIAIITFVYAASITVRWLDAAVKPSFLASGAQTVLPSNHLAMLPAAVPLKFKTDAVASE